MKAIMITDKPNYSALMMNGEKNILVRNSPDLANAIQKLINENGFADIYVCCSKDEYLYRTNKGYITSKKLLSVGKGTDYTFAYSDEGKVLFKFRCYSVEEIRFYESMIADWYDVGFETETLLNTSLYKKSCLSYFDLVQYLGDRDISYAIHISDLEIFDKPKELREFYKGFRNKYHKHEFGMDTHIDYYGVMVQPTKNGYEYTYPLTQAPKNFCYVEV